MKVEVRLPGQAFCLITTSLYYDFYRTLHEKFSHPGVQGVGGGMRKGDGYRVYVLGLLQLTIRLMLIRSQSFISAQQDDKHIGTLRHLINVLYSHRHDYMCTSTALNKSIMGWRY